MIIKRTSSNRHSAEHQIDYEDAYSGRKHWLKCLVGTGLKPLDLIVTVNKKDQHIRALDFGGER